MPRPRLLVAAVAVASVLLVPASAGAQVEKVPVIKLSGGASALTLDPAVAAAFSQLGLFALPITGAQADEDGAIVFKVTSGSLAGNQPAKGLIRHNGGLRLLQGSTGVKVDLNNLRVNDGDPAILTAQLGSGERFPLARMNFKDAKSGGTKKQLALTDIKLGLTSEAAAALNEAFGVTAFTNAQRIGTLDTVARYRIKIKPAR